MYPSNEKVLLSKVVIQEQGKYFKNNKMQFVIT